MMELAAEDPEVHVMLGDTYGLNRAISQFSQECLNDPEFRRRVVRREFYRSIRRRTLQHVTHNASAADGRSQLPDDYFDRMRIVAKILRKLPAFRYSPIGISVALACEYLEQTILVALAVSVEAGEDLMAFAAEFLDSYGLPDVLLEGVAEAALIICISWSTPVRLKFSDEEFFFYEFDPSDELHRQHLDPSGHSSLDDALKYMQTVQKRKRVPGWGRRRIEGIVERNITWLYQHKVRGKSLTALAQEELEGEGAPREEAKSRVYEGNRQRNVGLGIKAALALLAD